MRNPSWRGKVCVVFVMCVASAIAAQAQYTSLASFDGVNGAYPYYGSLLQGRDGNLYGTTIGALGSQHYSGGTIFKIAPQTGQLELMYMFLQKTGEAPAAGLIQATDGNFYGTTTEGGLRSACNMGCGTIFKITTDNALTLLYSFNLTDGADPVGGLLQAADGDLYGTTYGGGGNLSCGGGCGTVFKITRGGALTVLHDFTYSADGGRPSAALIQANDGNFYGTTSTGGRGDGGGTVFRITPAGTLTTIHNFCFPNNLCPDGRGPMGSLVQGIDGSLYGTTAYGGSGCTQKVCSGTVFKINLDGSGFKSLYGFDFEGQNGIYPYAGLIQATDGNFYGMTTNGIDTGAVFSITPAGELTTLYTFNNGAVGQFPLGGLLQATDGSFYGTTSSGGDSSCYCGTIFRLSTGLGPFVTLERYSGRVGTTGYILGQGFTGTSNVSLNGTSAAFTVVSDTLIKATVPQGATTGNITVATLTGTLTSNRPFHVVR